jgi:hypothetical protein
MLFKLVFIPKMLFQRRKEQFIDKDAQPEEHLLLLI